MENQELTTMQMITRLAEHLGNKAEDHKLYWALQKGMPEDRVREAAQLWLSGNPEDWSEADNMVFQHTSPYGSQYRHSLHFVPQDTKGIIYFARLDKRECGITGMRNWEFGIGN